MFSRQKGAITRGRRLSLTLKGNEKQFALAGNSSYRGNFQ